MAWGMLAAGIASGLATGAMSYASARQSQQETVDAYRNRHQWQVQDLRAAGLNPILSGTQGAGSVGNMATAQAPDISQATSNFSAAQLRREEINTNKTTQTQQLAQSENLLSTARESAARAEVEEKVAEEFRKDPNLARQKALSESGLSASSVPGSVWRFGKELDYHVKPQNLIYRSSAKENVKDFSRYVDGGSITPSKRQVQALRGSRSVKYRSSVRPY